MLVLSSDLGYMKTVNTMMHITTLALVDHGNSILSNMAMDICILKNPIKFNNGFCLKMNFP